MFRYFGLDESLITLLFPSRLLPLAFMRCGLCSILVGVPGYAKGLHLATVPGPLLATLGCGRLVAYNALWFAPNGRSFISSGFHQKTLQALPG